MSRYTTDGIEIVGITSSVPANRITEYDDCDRYGEATVKKFVRSTGIHSRYVVCPNQTASDLGYDAAERLLNDLVIDRNKVGVLLYVTLSPDYRRPATSCVLQMRLGLSEDCAVMDIGHGCAGFVYGHQVMLSLLLQSDSEYGLLITGDTLSVLQNPDDHQSMMFGDAGSAILYRKNQGQKIQTILKADGTGYRVIYASGGGFRDLNSPARFSMDGMKVFEFSTSKVLNSIIEYLDLTQTGVEDYDYIVLHQANISIIRILAKELGISEDKVGISLDRYGNTSGSSIPLTICDIIGEKELGSVNILVCGFGVGLAWGVTAFRVVCENVYPVRVTSNVF